MAMLFLFVLFLPTLRVSSLAQMCCCIRQVGGCGCIHAVRAPLMSKPGRTSRSAMVSPSDAHCLANKYAALSGFSALITRVSAVAQECQLASVRGGVFESAALAAYRVVGLFLRR